MQNRKCSMNRCTLFNCSKSLNKWTCCYYCKIKQKCKRKCLNEPKKCGFYKYIPDPCAWKTRGMREEDRIRQNKAGSDRREVTK